MRRILVGHKDEIPPGSRKIVTNEGRSIGIFNVEGRFYALRNRCPHMGAPLCLGGVGGTLLSSQPGEYRSGLEGQVLYCPWHHWEFDIKTGRLVVEFSRLRVKTFRVFLEDDMVVVEA